jgi:hypothetical protein
MGSITEVLIHTVIACVVAAMAQSFDAQVIPNSQVAF